MTYQNGQESKKVQNKSEPRGMTHGERPSLAGSRQKFDSLFPSTHTSEIPDSTCDPHSTAEVFLIRGWSGSVPCYLPSSVCGP